MKSMHEPAQGGLPLQAIVIVDHVSGNCLFANKEMVDFSGLDESETVGRPVAAWMQASRDSLAEYARLAGERGLHRTVLVRSADGEWQELFAYFLGIQESLLLILLRRTTSAADSIPSQLDLFFETSRDGIVILNTSGKVVRANPSFARLLEYEAREVANMSVWDWDVQWRPEELRKRLSQDLTGDVFETKHVTRTGKILDVEITRNRLVLEGDVHIACTCRDITDRNANNHLLKLASICYRNSSEGIMVCDLEGRIESVNPVFTRVTGYTLDDVRGKTARVLNSGRQDEYFYESMWQDIRSKGHWEGELYNKRKNGEIYPQRLVINVANNNSGEMEAIIAQFSDITTQKESERKIWHQAHFDQLTGLPNRNLLFDVIHQKALQKRNERWELTAVLLLDLDNFKEINDTLGHSLGDAVLCVIASRLQSLLRECDAIARFGGDEFVILLDGLRRQEDAGKVADKILLELSQPIEISDCKIRTTASIGIAMCPWDSTVAEDLLKFADQAMYDAKSKGPGGYSFFQQSMQCEALTRKEIVSDLRTALEGDELRIVYQPILDLASGRVCKAEALLRWCHPVKGNIPPGSFIPIAEGAGLIQALADHVVTAVARDLAGTLDRFEDLKVAVNFSAAQFSASQDIVYQRFHDIIGRTSANSRKFIIEITESLLLNNSSRIQNELNRFTNIGVDISLDDFGTGYSSLSYLLNFPMQYIKIDKSFITGLADSQRNQMLCQTIINLAHNLGIKVVAEGIESQPELDMLMTLNCDLGQGFLLSKPLELEDFQVFLDRASTPPESVLPSRLVQAGLLQPS